MSQEVVETEEGLKIRKLVDLRPSTAKEYQDAILNRVDHFSKRRDSVFNDATENIIVKALQIGLQAKVKIDELLGDNKDKIHEIVEKLLFLGL
ncbi:MAG: hypothetical protein BAJALOKI1v1_420009 [Promethearchaeota archaeon]|nr:MAG: hypothetical protein BAJALOKI1v1_420009 [Candidatus Lokiarchaeota archaeon]